MSKATKVVFAIGIVIALVLAGAALFQVNQPEPEARGFPIQYGNFVAPNSDSYIQLWDGADLVAYSDEGSTQTFSLDGATGNLEFEGVLDLDGEKLDIDADADTSITADTDDQVDIEVGGADLFTLKDWGASSIVTDTTENLFEIFDSTPVITGGTVSLAGLNLDLGIGNSTGGTNSIYGILIDGITQDAQNTEVAISVATGWDKSLDVENAVDIGGDLTVNDALTVTQSSGNTDVAGTLQYGADDLYVLGFASSGQQVVYGTSSITGTESVAHGLTTVTYCMATLGQDPDDDAGDAAHVTVAVAANACTVKAWQDDFVTAATETDVAVQWVVIGAP